MNQKNQKVKEKSAPESKRCGQKELEPGIHNGDV